MRYLTLIVITLLIAFPSHSASAEQLARAEGEELAAAMGHYARSRSLLIEAIREFERGERIADPNALLDSQAWRANLAERTQELDKVLDPQPRANNTGVKFQADKRLINEAKE